MIEAEHIFETGKMQDAIIACIDISKKNPEAVGLADLQQRITRKLAEDRIADAEKRTEATNKLLGGDAKGFSVSPETYRQKKLIVGDNTTLRAVPTAMQKALNAKGGADLNALKGVTVPVRLTGPFDAIEWKILWSQVAAKAVENKLKEKLNDKLGELLGGGRGNSSDAAASAPPSPKRQLEDQLKGTLKGLFK